MKPEKLLFVYGTLKKDHLRSQILFDQKFVGNFRTTKGYKLYNIGRFPGIIEVPDSDSYVEGELWSVDEDYFDYLDRIEGSPTLFKLQKIQIEGTIYETFAYFWQRGVEGLEECGPIWTKDKEC